MTNHKPVLYIEASQKARAEMRIASHLTSQHIYISSSS